MKLAISVELLERLLTSFIVFEGGKVIYISKLAADTLGLSAAVENIEINKVFGDNSTTVQKHLKDAIENSLAEGLVTCRVGSKELLLIFKTTAIETESKTFCISFIEPLNSIQRKMKSFALMGCSIPGIVHNVSNPLTVVLNRIQIMKMKGVEPEQMDTLISEIKKMQIIFDNISLKSIKEMNPEEEPIDINSVVRANMEFLIANSYVKHNIKKELTLNGIPRMVRGNFLDLSQIFLAFFYITLKSVEDKDNKFMRIETGYKNGKAYINFSSNGIAPDRLIKSALEGSVQNSNSYTKCFTGKINLDWTFENLKHLLNVYRVELDYGVKPEGNYLSIKFPAEEKFQ